MKSPWFLLLLCLTGLIVILMAVDPSWAGNENQVAMVVDFGNGQIAAKCVSFQEDSITGYEALQRSGLPVEIDFQTGGAAICRIDGQGCPSDDCFCACRGGGECKYWSYWHFVNGTWSYSVAGSGIYKLQDGAIDGWVWGLGSVDQAKPPPAIPFNEICIDENAASPTATSTPRPTSTPMVLPTRAPTENAPNPTATTSIAIATVSVSASPTMPMATTANPTSGPIAIGNQTETPIPEAPFDAGETPVPVAPPSLGGGESYPGQPGGGLPEAASPEPDAPIITAPQPVGGEMIVASTPEAITETGIGGGLLDSNQSTSLATSTSTPVAVSAVIGMSTIIDKPVIATATSQVDESSPRISYIGFFGLLLLLAALALLIYRRREMIHPGGSG